MLAILNREPGCEIVEAVLSSCQIGAVNLAEVSSKLNEYGFSDAEVSQTIEETELTIVPFDQKQALRAGALRSSTRGLGLSLGDRACLALAERTATISLIADRSWDALNFGIRIKLIR